MTHESYAKFKNLLKLGQVLNFVRSNSPRWTFFNASLAVFQGLLPFVALYLLRLLIDAITVDLRHHGGEAAVRRIIILLILTASTNALTSILRSVSAVTGEQQTQEVVDKMQYALQRQSVAVDLNYYENPKFYDTLHRAQVEAPFRAPKIVANLTQLIMSGMTLVAISALILVAIGWPLALLLVCLTLPAVFVKLFFADRVYNWQREATVSERILSYFNWLVSSDTAAKEIRLFNLGSLFVDRSAGLRTSLRNGRMKINRDRALADGTADIISTVAVYITFGAVTISAIAGTATIGALVVFFQAIQRGQSALQDLLSSIADLYENNLFLNNLYEFLDLPTLIKDPASPVEFPRPLQKGITFDHVSFTFESNNRPVLQDISFTINAGETIALVGENGAGKTTLIKLLCRLYEPSEGVITIDGIRLAAFTVADLRQELGVAFQDYMHYNLTAKENIWLGDISQPNNVERIKSAAKSAGADLIIDALPQGYDSQLGYMFSEGNELSIGQWQKVALARAFFRHSQILLLDEPSSALDAKSELDVFEAFRKLAKDKTAIIVSHRLSSVRSADRILVLDHGKIVEDGTHDELVALGGMYGKIFEIQAANYDRPEPRVIKATK